MGITALAPGSLGAVARAEGVSLAESFLSADAIILVDTSGSMSAQDTGEKQSRYDVACAELKTIQRNLPGKVAVISFSSSVEFAAGGIPRFSGGGTDMAAALRFVHAADGTDIRFIVISDGQPNDAEGTLKVAKTFTSKIDTVFIGPAGDPGADFLRKLAAASGGQYSQNKVSQIAERIERLLLTC